MGQTAVKIACAVANNILNTGVDCDISMGAPAMLFIVPPGFSFTLADLAEPVTFFTAAIHNPLATRIYPLFGNNAPVRKVNNGKEADVAPTLDDGSQVFVRYGYYNRTLSTYNGGLCMAQTAASLNSCGYGYIEIDNQNHILCHNNGDGTYGGVNCSFMYAPSPEQADFKMPAFNNFFTSTNPSEILGYGIILSGGMQLLDLNGLISVDVTAPNPTVAASTSQITVAITVECSQESLVQELQVGDTNALALAANFIVTNITTPGTVVPSGVTVDGTGKNLILAGTYVAGDVYTVALAPAATLLANGVEGYEGIGTLTVTIP